MTNYTVKFNIHAGAVQATCTCGATALAPDQTRAAALLAPHQHLAPAKP